MKTKERKLSFWPLILALMLFTASAWSQPLVFADGCELDLTSGLPRSLIFKSHSRESLGSAGSYLPGDGKSMKLLDVQGADKRALSEAIIQQLHFRKDQRISPYLQPVIETVLKLADQMGAVFSISSWVMPDGLRTIRMSLDMANNTNLHLHIVRLPNLDIRDGVPAKRIDIDLTPERLTLLSGTAQAVSDNDTLVVGEPASHSLGLEIDFTHADHPVIDAFSARVEYFIGGKAPPELSRLLSTAYELTRGILPEAKDQRFRTRQEIRAVNYGNGWQISH